MSKEPKKIMMSQEEADKLSEKQANALRKDIADKIAKEVTWRDMRIMWLSVAPFINSGYGTVTRYFLTGLLNRGFTSFCSAYYGIQPGGMINWKGIYVLPVEKSDFDKIGFLTTYEHYKRFQCDLGVFHSDFWISLQFAKRIPYSLCYSPIDHENYPEKWLTVLRNYKWVAVPSMHAQKELAKNEIKSTFVPHGVNTKIYQPMNKERCRQSFTLEKDKFIVGVVAANNDDETRKGWDATFQAYKYFLDANPDAKKDSILFVHTNPENPKGRNLLELSRQIGIHENVIWNDRYTTSVISLPEEAMARLYNCFDTFLLMSRREGFCIPVLEAQACGVPCILNDFSALTERNDYGKCGWLTKPSTYTYSGLNALNSIPDPYKGADALTEAYNNESKRKMFAKRSLAYARKQTWDIALDKYLLPLLEEIGQSIPRTNPKAVTELKKIASSEDKKEEK